MGNSEIILRAYFFILVVNVALRTELSLWPKCTHFRNEKTKIFGICGL